MARLNELPGPTESLEALKRRFVRQNREIARVNSLQSLRIQSLEAELSHQLKENAVLKEQVISLSQDAEKFAAGRTFYKDISRCKEKLAAKVSELNSLVGELGMIPDSFMKKTTHASATNASTSASSQRFPDPNRRPMAWEENGDKLPTIVEDKYFPRRTLDSEDLGATVQDLDSPTIGSPPVAHFDVDQSPLLLTKHNDFALSTNDDLASDLNESIHSSNIDNRNSPLIPSNSVNEDNSIPSPSVSPSKSVPLPTFSGSKRKFSATEDEITFLPLHTKSAMTIDDDFQFTRTAGVSRGRRPNVAVESNNDSPGHGRQQKKGNMAKRRVLEPKTTNMASTPRKTHGTPVQLVNDSKPENLPKIRGEEENMRKTVPAKKASQFQCDQTKRTKRGSTATTLQNEAPKPVVLDSDSMEKERSRSKKQSESDINEPAVTETTPLPNLASRPSRRARGAISYAEPNLRDKMRRATNEMVDAVAMANDRRISSSLTMANHELDGDDGTSPDQENVAGITARTTQDNQIVAELPKHLITERKRRTLSASTNEFTRLNRAESETSLRQNNEYDETKALSSPPTTNAAKEHPRRRSANPNSQSRRHSSHPAVYDHGKTIQPDKVSHCETSEIGSEYQDDDTCFEASLSRKIGNKIMGTASVARVKGTRPLVEDNNVQASRSQRSSSRRRSTLL